MSQQSPEPTVGEERGPSLDRGSLEPGEERGQVAKGFSRSFAPTGAGQKALPGEPSVQLHLKSLCLGRRGSPGARRHGRPRLRAGLAFGVTPGVARPQSSQGARTLEIWGAAGLGVYVSTETASSHFYLDLSFLLCKVGIKSHLLRTAPTGTSHRFSATRARRISCPTQKEISERRASCHAPSAFLFYGSRTLAQRGTATGPGLPSKVGPSGRWDSQRGVECWEGRPGSCLRPGSAFRESPTSPAGRP